MKDELNLEKVLSELADSHHPALEELFNYYYPRLYNFSRAFLKLEDGIDDILQEVFVKIWKNRQNITTTDTFNSYIFTITRNLLLNELRSRLNDQKIRDKILQSSVAKEYLSFEITEFEELARKVEMLIEELPARQREIFKLSRTEGLSHKEIAEKLNITAKTVEYHIRQAITYIKGKLKALGLISLLYFYLFI
ncbi:MAG: RNA polymerase sigma-70 factor [Prolixibacteraceae bacterium]